MKRKQKILCVLALVLVLTGCDANKKPYQSAVSLFDEGAYAQAAEAFEALGEYEDAPARLLDSLFLHGKELLEQKEYQQAIDTLKDLPQAEVKTLIAQAQAELDYIQATETLRGGNLALAVKQLFALDGLHDAEEKLQKLH